MKSILQRLDRQILIAVMSVLFWQSIVAQTMSGSINSIHEVKEAQVSASTPPSPVSASFPIQKNPLASRNLRAFRSGSVQVAVSIIESESNNSGHVMDTVWAFAARSLGYVPTIRPQTALDDTAFFGQTNLLIISSGVIDLPANRAKTILQFIRSGKPVYLQGEYLPTYSTNIYFDALVDSLGGAFTPGGTVSGNLAPMAVTGTLSTTPNSIASLAYFWYGCSGTGDALTCIPFLSYQNNNFGFTFTPPNSAYGKVIMTTDQDWIRDWGASAGLPLIENILVYLSNATQGTAPVITVSPSSFNVSLQQGDSTTRTLTIGNTGNADLTWSFSNLSRTLSVDYTVSQIQSAKFTVEVRRLQERRVEKQKLIELKKGSTTESRAQTLSMPQSMDHQPSNAARSVAALFPTAQFFAQFPDYSGNYHPMSIAFDGTYYWVVGGGTSSGDVAQLNKDFSLVITKNVNLDCRSISYNRADGKVYIKDYSTNSLYRLHTAPFDGTVDLVLNNIFQSSQTKVVITEDGQYLYDQLAGNVRKYRFSDGAVVKTFTLALQYALDWPRENLLALSGSYLLTVAGGTVYAYDTTSGAFLSSSSLPGSQWSEWSMSYSSGLFLITNTAEDTWFAYRIDDGSQLGWMTANPDSGLITPGSSQDVAIKFITKNLTPGNYSDTIRIVSNDTINNPKKVPVALSVTGGTGPAITVTPSSFNVSLQSGDSTTQTLAIGNIGNASLNWTITNPSQFADKFADNPKRDASHDIRVTTLRADEGGPSARSVPSSGPKFMLPAALPFYDGFENGNFDQWQLDGVGGVREVTNATAAQGSYSFHHQSAVAGQHNQGIHKDFAAGSQPQYIGFYVRPGSSSLANAYCVFYSDTLGQVSSGQAIWFYAVNGHFYINADVGGDETYNFNVLQWYFIEFRNIDWIAKNFDYYVNGVLVKADIPFRNAGTTNELRRLYIYNYDIAEAWWDDINVGAAGNWLTVTPTSGSVGPGSSQDVSVKINAHNLGAGTYNNTVTIASNDSVHNPKNVPVNLTVGVTSITSVVPDSAVQGQTLPVTITGQNTSFRVVQGSLTFDANQVWFSQGSSTINAYNVNVSSATGLTANFTIPNLAPTGLWDVNVLQPAGKGVVTLSNGFTINPSGSGVVMSLSDAEVDFIGVRVGQTSDITFMIRDSSISSGNLTGTVNLTGAGFTLLSGGGPFNLSPGQGLSLTVQYNAAVAGFAKGSLTITNNSTNYPTTLVVPVRGFGVQLASSPKKILFDSTHGFAGGEINYFSEFVKLLRAAGHTVYTDPFNLTGIDALITAAQQRAFTNTEITQIQSFVNAGGKLIMLADWGGHFGAMQQNALLSAPGWNTGIKVDSTMVQDSTQILNGRAFWIKISTFPNLPDPLLVGVDTLAVYASASLTVTPPAQSVATTTSGGGASQPSFLISRNVVLDGQSEMVEPLKQNQALMIKGFSGTAILNRTGSAAAAFMVPTGKIPVIAKVSVGSGQIVVTGDVNIFANAAGTFDGYAAGIRYAANRVLALNLLQSGGSLIPTPHILSVRDVPNDNGRQVFVKWKVDQPAVSSGIARFGVWRKDSVWTFLKDSVLTVNDTVFQFVAPTIYDSTKVSGMRYSVFRVSAHNVNPAIFSMSSPDSGYSLDDLAPSVPKGVKGSVQGGGGIIAVVLQWNKVPEKDLRYYAVYRSETAGFTQVDTATFVGASADTTFRDTTVVYGKKYYYRVVAFDWSGNRSDPSDQLALTVTSVGKVGFEIPKEFSLAQNYPNPFNPSTTIRYGIPTQSRVRIEIFNSIGQHVATLVDGEREAGYYEVEWRTVLASGMYIYRIEAVAADNPNNAFIQVKKMLYVR